MENILFFVLGLVIHGMILVLWFKRRLARRRLMEMPDGSDPIYGTREELERGERESGNRRVELLKTHVLFDRFETLHNYNESVMTDLQKALADQGIASDYVFQQTLMPGVMDSLFPQGVYEFYVQADQVERAAEIVRDKLK